MLISEHERNVQAKKAALNFVDTAVTAKEFLDLIESEAEAARSAGGESYLFWMNGDRLNRLMRMQDDWVDGKQVFKEHVNLPRETLTEIWPKELERLMERARANDIDWAAAVKPDLAEGAKFDSLTRKGSSMRVSLIEADGRKSVVHVTKNGDVVRYNADGRNVSLSKNRPAVLKADGMVTHRGVEEPSRIPWARPRELETPKAFGR